MPFNGPLSGNRELADVKPRILLTSSNGRGEAAQGFRQVKCGANEDRGKSLESTSSSGRCQARQYIGAMAITIHMDHLRQRPKYSRNLRKGSRQGRLAVRKSGRFVEIRPSALVIGYLTQVSRAHLTTCGQRFIFTMNLVCQSFSLLRHE
jgi:hypothetical protein